MINGSNIRLPNGQFSTLVTPVDKDGVTQYVTPVDENGNVITGGGGGGGSTSPGGSTTQIQFNDGGSFAGDSGLTYIKATDTLNAGALITGYLTANPIRNNGVETINSTSKPTTRVDASALVTGDKWYHPTLQKDVYWDGTDWVSQLLIGELPRFTGTTVGGNPATQTSIPFTSGTVIKIKNFFVSYSNSSATPAANYLTAQLVIRNGSLNAATSTDLGTPLNLNTADGLATGAINSTITLGTGAGQAITFGLRTALGAGTAPTTQIQASFSYTVVY